MKGEKGGWGGGVLGKQGNKETGLQVRGSSSCSVHSGGAARPTVRDSPSVLLCLVHTARGAGLDPGNPSPICPRFLCRGEREREEETEGGRDGDR